MNANLEPKAVERNVWRDTMRDGLMEFFLGAYLLLTGFLIWTDNSAFFILLFVIAPPLLKQMKERFTYPRIGYVKFNEQDRNVVRRILAAAIGAVVAIGMVVFLNSADERVQSLYKWTPLLPALIFQAALIPMGRKTGFIRFYVMAGIALLVGFIISLIELPNKLDNIGLYVTVMGALFLLLGVFIFADFLRTHPVRAEEAQ